MESCPLFLSYASADLQFAERINYKVSGAGFRVWFDKTRLRPGFDWHKEVERASDASRVVLAVLTPNWKISSWTRYETYGAESIIPILVEGSWSEVATPPLSRLQNLTLPVDTASEQDWQLLFSSIREKLDRLAPLKTNRVVLMRYDPIQHFVGREEKLSELHEKLFSNPTTALTQGRVQAVTALGGVGKSTLARHYAERYWRAYRRMFWVDCREGMETGFARIHDKLRPEPVYAALSDRDKARWAFEEVSQPERPLTLLILDNAQDQDSLAGWIPKSGDCHTLITSRFTAWTGSVERCEVSVLRTDPARELLLKRSKRENALGERDGADAVAKKVGYLPLALEQAAAYVAEQPPGFGFAEYLRLYEGHERELLDAGTPGATEYPASVYTTWRATTDRLPLGARAILRLHSFLAPTPFPAEIYVKGASMIEEYATQLADTFDSATPCPAGMANASELDVRNWIASLFRYSMAIAQSDDSFSVHDLVQAVERHRLGEGATQTLKCVTDLFLAQTGFASWEVGSRRRWDLLLPHAEKLIEAAEALEPPSSADMLERAAHGYERRGQYDRAIRAERKCVEVRNQKLGTEHDATLTSVNNLAQLLKSAGCYADAEALYERALTAREKLLGKEHPDTLASLQGLAQLLDLKGQREAAEPLFRRALEGLERRLGEDHPETLTCACNLSSVVYARGDYEHSEALLRRALEAQERVLGKDHPSTLISVSNLAQLFAARGMYDQAEPLLRRALETVELALGKDHPDTVALVVKLAWMLEECGNYHQAEPLFRRAMEARERVLGKKHPDTLDSMTTLAVLLRDKGDYAQAEPLLRRIIDAQERVLGRDHPGTMVSVEELAMLLESLGNYEEAEVLLREVIQTEERVLGKDHPSTLTSVGNLGLLLHHKGDLDQAERLCLRTLEARERVLGTDHPSVLSSRENLASLLAEKGDHDRAEHLLRRTLEVKERVLGMDNPSTLISVSNLAELLREKGDYAHAEPLLRRALNTRERTLGKDHPDTLISVNNLAALLLSQGHHKQAEHLWRIALESKERVLGRDHPSTLTAVSNLAIAVERRGDNEGAELLYRRAFEDSKRVLGPKHASTLLRARDFDAIKRKNAADF